MRFVMHGKSFFMLPLASRRAYKRGYVSVLDWSSFGAISRGLKTLLMLFCGPWFNLWLKQYRYVSNPSLVLLNFLNDEWVKTNRSLVCFIRFMIYKVTGVNAPRVNAHYFFFHTALGSKSVYLSFLSCVSLVRSREFSPKFCFAVIALLLAWQVLLVRSRLVCALRDHVFVPITDILIEIRCNVVFSLRSF